MHSVINDMQSVINDMQSSMCYYYGMPILALRVAQKLSCHSKLIHVVLLFFIDVQMWNSDPSRTLDEFKHNRVLSGLFLHTTRRSNVGVNEAEVLLWPMYTILIQSRVCQCLHFNLISRSDSHVKARHCSCTSLPALTVRLWSPRPMELGVMLCLTGRPRCTLMTTFSVHPLN